MNRSNAVLLGSFLIVATSLYFYFGVGLLPIFLGGLFAFGMTYLFQKFKKK